MMVDAAYRSDTALRVLFACASAGLPLIPGEPVRGFKRRLRRSEPDASRA